MRAIDVRHLGRDRVIACFEHDGVLVDPGPESTVETLLGELEGPPRAVLLTHIHFDHAGGAGALVQRFPDLKVHVHPRGARHLHDPERLVSSATRLYGETGMQELWGEVVPIPQDNLVVLEGGETVLEDYRVEYTPGHASHHVCYLHEPTGTALTGDVAGVRIAPSGVVVAPTPPPDIDVEAWERSIDVVAGWKPTQLALTHFGLFDDVESHLERQREALREQAALVRGTDLDEFITRIRAHLAAKADPATVESFVQAAPVEHIWLGLTRYWSQREG